jgi:putative heme iron utilization protein
MATPRGHEARRLLRRFHAGVLSTHSLKHPGYPYGAALPYATDAQGAIVVLISHLAEHTQNLQQDARVSFTVSPLAYGFQSEERLCVLGDAALTEDANSAERYLRVHPEGQQYLEIGGFRFYRIEPRHARLIAGFGSLHWIDGPNLLAPALPIAQAEADVLRHMNADHPHNLVDYCRHVHGMQAKNAQMCGIDCDGFDVRADGTLLRFDFARLVEDAEQARQELVALARASRAS